MRTSKKLLIPVIAIMTFLFGFENGAFQLVLQQVATTFGLNDTMMGTLVAAQYAGLIVLPLVCGPIADRFGKKKVLIVFSSLFALGCILASLAQGPGVFMTGVFLLGASLGVIESQEAAILSDAIGEAAGRKLSFIHCMFSLGAVLSPLIMQFCMVRFGVSWRFGFSVPGFGFLPLLVLLFFTNCGEKTALQNTSEPVLSRGMLKTLFSVVFIGLVASMLCYLGMETGIAYFLDSLFTDLFPASGFSALSISLFWLSVTVSRFIFGIVKADPRAIIKWCFFVACPVMLLLAFGNQVFVALGMCVLSGIAYAPIWPLLVAEAARTNPTCSGTATSVMSSASGIGAVVAPILMGWAAGSLGIRGSFVLLALLSLIGFVTCALCFRKKRVQDTNIVASGK